MRGRESGRDARVPRGGGVEGAGARGCEGGRDARVPRRGVGGRGVTEGWFFLFLFNRAMIHKNLNDDLFGDDVIYGS